MLMLSWWRVIVPLDAVNSAKSVSNGVLIAGHRRAAPPSQIYTNITATLFRIITHNSCDLVLYETGKDSRPCNGLSVMAGNLPCPCLKCKTDGANVLFQGVVTFVLFTGD